MARNSAILLPTCEVKCSEGTCGLMTVYTSSTIIWHSTWDRTKNKLVKECYTGAICYEGEFVWSGVRPYASILDYGHLVWFIACVFCLHKHWLIEYQNHDLFNTTPKILTSWLGPISYSKG